MNKNRREERIGSQSRYYECFEMVRSCGEDG